MATKNRIKPDKAKQILDALIIDRVHSKEHYRTEMQKYAWELLMTQKSRIEELERNLKREIGLREQADESIARLKEMIRKLRNK